jgi:hypothetical protein
MRELLDVPVMDDTAWGPFDFAQGRLFDCIVGRFANDDFAQGDRVGGRS